MARKLQVYARVMKTPKIDHKSTTNFPADHLVNQGSASGSVKARKVSNIKSRGFAYFLIISVRLIWTYVMYEIANTAAKTPNVINVHIQVTESKVLVKLSVVLEKKFV